MVSNHREEAGFYPPLFFSLFFPLFFFLLIFSPGLHLKGQKINKYYVSSIVDKGSIYFIRPQKGFKNTVNHSKLIYDMSYVIGKDSVTFNYSYYDRMALTPDSLIFGLEDQKTFTPTKKIFIESKGSKWHYRYTSKIALKDIQNFFNPGKKARITITDGDKELQLICSQRKWNKFARINTRIFELIGLNK